MACWWGVRSPADTGVVTWLRNEPDALELAERYKVRYSREALIVQREVLPAVLYTR